MVRIFNQIDYPNTKIKLIFFEQINNFVLQSPYIYKLCE
jgi:hypothetical protein